VNIVTASFNTIMRQMIKMSQRKNSAYNSLLWEATRFIIFRRNTDVWMRIHFNFVLPFSRVALARYSS